MPKNKIHFEISERKMIRLFDVIFVLFQFIFGRSFFDFEYLEVAVTNVYWALFW
jgi:hypothetical protein